jgi:hypothetical protein
MLREMRGFVLYRRVERIAREYNNKRKKEFGQGIHLNLKIAI